MLPMQRAVAAQFGGDPEAADDLLEARLASHPWLSGDAFGFADCAAMPALFYASAVRSFEPGRPALADGFARMRQRPSIARVLREAAPWLRNFPLRAHLPEAYVPSPA